MKQQAKVDMKPTQQAAAIERSAPEQARSKPADLRRQEIMAAAAHLFQDRGYGETTVSDIASAAGVATGTVYLHFPSKDHILLGLHEQFHEGMAARIAAITAESFERRARGEERDFRETIDSIVEAIVTYSLEERDKAEVCIRHLPASGNISDLGSVDRHFIQFLAGIFQAASSEGMIEAADPEMLAYLLNAAIGYPIGTHLAFGDPPDLARLLAAMKDLLHRALAPAN